VKSSGNPEPQEGAKVVVMLRVVSPLKSRLAAYARARGLTLNAAAVILLGQALDDEQTRQPSPSDAN